MGTFYDDEGLHWEPIRWFPWVEHATGIQTIDNEWVDRNWYRRAPTVIEQTEALDGTIIQTVQFKDGREQVRAVTW